MADKLIIFDTTLRDGEQSPGASMTKDEKVRIAKQLERLRVDVIEAGFAAASNGDFEAIQTGQSNSAYTPLTLAPDQTGTITLTFTPSAAKGTVVRGFIGVDTLNLGTVSGDELVNIPYTYTVG